MIPKTHRLTHLKNFKGRIYLVGGWVRDYLLGRLSQDLDFLIEGGDEHYRQALARIKRLYPPVRNSQEFFLEYATARWVTANAERIDCARPRVEVYDHPGSLPKVRLVNSIHEDLARRDFSINAMAVGISKFSGNDWVDPHNGRGDIKKRKLRILHPKSFQDDPTRLMRGLRLGARLGFEFDPETGRLAQEALSGRALEMISWQRFRDEFTKAMDESDWPGILEEFSRHGIVLGGLKNFGPRLLKTSLAHCNALERLSAVYFWNLLEGRTLEKLSQKDWPRREWGRVLGQLEQLSKSSWKPSEPMLPATFKAIQAVKPAWALIFKRPKPVFFSGGDLKKFNIVETDRGKLMKYLFELALKGRLKNRVQALKEIRRWT